MLTFAADSLGKRLGQLSAWLACWRRKRMIISTSFIAQAAMERLLPEILCHRRRPIHRAPPPPLDGLPGLPCELSRRRAARYRIAAPRYADLATYRWESMPARSLSVDFAANDFAVIFGRPD